MNLKICNLYDMEIDRSLAGLATGTYDSFFDISSKRLRKLCLGSFCYYSILRESFQTLENVLELFGGIGRSSLIIERLFNPKYHDIFELNQKYANHIAKTFHHEAVRIHAGDAFSYEYERDFDLVCLDHPSLTFKICEDDPQVSKMIKDAASHSRSILMTFIGLSKVAPLRDYYSSRYGAEIHTQEDYLRVGAGRLIHEFGPQCIYYTGSVFYVMFTKGWTKEPKLRKVTQEDARGWFRIAE